MDENFSFDFVNNISFFLSVSILNSIIFDSKAAKNYIRHRVNFGLTEKTRDLRKSDLFLQNANEVHNLNRIAGSWWATELTRNGSNYSSSKNAFLCSTFFTDRYMNMNFIHYRQFGIGMANYFYNNDKARFKNSQIVYAI